MQPTNINVQAEFVYDGAKLAHTTNLTGIMMMKVTHTF